MFKRPGWGRRLLIALIVAAGAAGLTLQLDARTPPKALPDRLTDQEFWKLVGFRTMSRS